MKWQVNQEINGCIALTSAPGWVEMPSKRAQCKCAKSQARHGQRRAASRKGRATPRTNCLPILPAAQPHLRAAEPTAQPSSRPSVPPWRSHAHSVTDPAAEAASTEVEPTGLWVKREGHEQWLAWDTCKQQPAPAQACGLHRQARADRLPHDRRAHLPGCTWARAANRRPPSRRRRRAAAAAPAWRAHPA